MAASLTFPREWVLQIKEMLNDADNNSLLNTAAILRVPTPLLKTNPEAYIPQFISFGPYHHSTLEKDINSPCAESKIATAEALKRKYAARLSKKLDTYGKSFDYVVEMMGGMRQKIERFYHWPTCTEGENSQNFALMMAIDSSFLLQFLIENTAHKTQPTDDEMVSLCTFYSECINYDMIKMENQIPLFVLKGIFEYAKEALRLQDFNQLLEGRYTPFRDFNKLLETSRPDFNVLLERRLERGRYTPFPDLNVLLERSRCTRFPNFDVRLEISRCNLYPDLDIIDEITREPHYMGDEITREPHYLGHAQASHSILLKTQAGGGEDQAREIATLQKLKQKLNGIREELAKWIGCLVGLESVSVSGLFPNGISAVQLARAGIKFKAFSNPAGHNLQLDIISGTAYLPQIVVCDVGTEVFLRNMLALEFNDAFRPKYVTSYVALMGILVQSPEDVRMLVRQRIISPGHFTDEGMVKLWNDVRQPFLGVTAVEDELSKALEDWYKQHYWIHLKIKVKRKVSGLLDYMWSWRFIAPLAGFLGLAMTAIQTYCSVHQC